MTTAELETAIINRALTWPVEDCDLEKFIQLSKDCGSAEIVIDRWGKFNRNNRQRKTPALFFEWWESNRPDKKNEDPKEQHVRKVDSAALPGFKELPWRR